MTTITAGRTVGEVMTRTVLTVPDTMTARELAEFLAQYEISGAPVVAAGNGKLVGVVSTFDLARVASEKSGWNTDATESYDRTTAIDDDSMFELSGREELAAVAPEGAETQVREFMTTVIQSVDEVTPLAEVARTMVDGPYHRLPVTRDGVVVGIVTALDLLNAFAEDAKT